MNVDIQVSDHLLTVPVPYAYMVVLGGRSDPGLDRMKLDLSDLLLRGQESPNVHTHNVCEPLAYYYR